MGKIDNQNTKKQVVFLGESGFPIGLATIQRLTLMAKALQFAGAKATVICRKGVWKKDQEITLDTQGSFEGVEYMYTTKSPFKPEGFVDRNVQKLKGIYGEYKYLKKLHKQNKIEMAIISDMKVVHVLRYYIFTSILGIPMVANFVEMTSSMQHREKFLKRVNDYIHDNWVIKLYDAALPISDKLQNYYKIISPTKPQIKLPILCEFEKFKVDKNPEEPYFLYCGSFRYTEVRNFIVEAYKNIPKNDEAKLYMIISGGSKKETSALEQELNALFKRQQIILFSNISYSHLVQLFTNAIALLIPLRPTIQDAARFPHKIGEYLATGNPVITTAVGEINNYFEDEKTALVAKEYVVENFAKKMQFVIENPQKAKEIGLLGQELGYQEFDYKSHGKRLLEFVKQL